MELERAAAAAAAEDEEEPGWSEPAERLLECRSDDGLGAVDEHKDTGTEAAPHPTHLKLPRPFDLLLPPVSLKIRTVTASHDAWPLSTSPFPPSCGVARLAQQWAVAPPPTRDEL